MYDETVFSPQESLCANEIFDEVEVRRKMEGWKTKIEAIGAVSRCCHATSKDEANYPATEFKTSLQDVLDQIAEMHRDDDDDDDGDVKDDDEGQDEVA